MNVPKSTDAGSVRAVGLMTGTVLDGYIDVAMLETDGHQIESIGKYSLQPYSKSTLSLLQSCVEQAGYWQFQGAEPSVFRQAEVRMTQEQSTAVCTLIRESGLSISDVAVVGFHGQTVLHRAPKISGHPPIPGRTKQLGDGRLMAKTLGLTVVNDFRSEDMRHGGQGAPLSCIYHRALMSDLAEPGATAILNLGGVANLSWWDGEHKLIAFDTGPANAPINDWIRSCNAGDMDQDGLFAAGGQVDESLLTSVLEHDYFSQSFPKSLDRNDFAWTLAKGMSLKDGAAFLSALCAASVQKGLDLLPGQPSRLVVTGGGRHNPVLMQMLSERTACHCVTAETMGWRGDAMEAECFAYLAVRRLRGLPASYPQTTGVARPVCGGVIHNY